MPERDFYYRFSAEILAGWKTYPVRVQGPRLSKCHQLPTLLVHSRTRGFVTANCSKCGAPDTVREEEFLSLNLWVSCPICRHQMNATKLCEVRGDSSRAPNYSYACGSCGHYILLADLLPHWKDVDPGLDDSCA